MSVIRFPEKALRFDNALDFFVQEVVENFPTQADNFQKLLKTISEYDALSLETKSVSGREVVSSIIRYLLLVGMIFCPFMFYGNAQENDMGFGQFVIMLNSIFCEGFARSHDGFRTFLDAG